MVCGPMSTKGMFFGFYMAGYGVQAGALEAAGLQDAAEEAGGQPRGPEVRSCPKAGALDLRARTRSCLRGLAVPSGSSSATSRIAPASTSPTGR